MKKRYVFLALLLAALAACFAYTRPLTLGQLCPTLPMEHCSRISGSYQLDPSVYTEEKGFSVQEGEEGFDELYALLCGRTYCRTVRDMLHLIPHRYQVKTGDFRWTVTLRFDPVPPSGEKDETHETLWLEYKYGDLIIDTESGEHLCRSEEAWAEEILALIQRHPLP